MFIKREKEDKNTKMSKMSKTPRVPRVPRAPKYPHLSKISSLSIASEFPKIDYLPCPSNGQRFSKYSNLSRLATSFTIAKLTKLAKLTNPTKFAKFVKFVKFADFARLTKLAHLANLTKKEKSVHRPTFRSEFKHIIREAAKNRLLTPDSAKVIFVQNGNSISNQPLPLETPSEKTLHEENDTTVTFYQGGNITHMDTRSIPLIDVERVKVPAIKASKSPFRYSLDEKELGRLCMRFHSLPITSNPASSSDNPAIILSNSLPAQYVERQQRKGTNWMNDCY